MPNEHVILLIEDDENDALIATRALRQAGVTSPITHLRDGEEAINYLSGFSPFHDRSVHPLPNLILLDLKMPKFTGLDVLTWLQSQPDLAKIPVIILTGSVHPEDRKEAKRLGAVGYEVKPVEFEHIVAIAQTVKLRLPQPPPRPAS
jgi:CheY-like chemotaxis protein